MKNLRSYQPETILENCGIDDNALEKYVGKSEDELISALLDSVDEAKASGTFDPKSLENFIAAVSPNLDEAQREKLAAVARIINGD